MDLSQSQDPLTQASIPAPMTPEEFQQYRLRVVQKEPISLEEMRRVVQHYRAGRMAGNFAPKKKPSSGGRPAKKPLALEDLM